MIRYVRWFTVVLACALASGATASRSDEIDLKFGTTQFGPSGGLNIVVVNSGPTPAADVQVVVEPFHPRIILSSVLPCVHTGYRLTCSFGNVSPPLKVFYLQAPLCAAAVPVTVSVSTATPESDLGNNTIVIPARADAGPNCDEVLNPPPVATPPAGGGGGGGGGGGNGGGSGGVPPVTTPPPTPEATVTPTATPVGTPTDKSTPEDSAAAIVDAMPTASQGLGYGFAIGVAGVVALLAAGAMTGWWVVRRRGTGH